MVAKSRSHQRRGAVLVLTVLCLVGLLGFLALAIDLGIVAVARTECQNAADAAAMAGARALNGDVANNNNYANASPTALAAAAANAVLGQAIQSSQVTVDLGSFTYDESQEKFLVRLPRDPEDNWSLARVRVSASHPTAFARIFGMSAINAAAMATAAHRPRDVAVVLDFSGSMRFDSLLGIPYTGNRTKSNNPETVFPGFGHYSDVAGAALQNPNSSTTISGIIYGSANVTVETSNGPAIVEDFYQNAAGASPVKAFSPAADSYASTPNGDNFLKTNGDKGANYAQTFYQVNNNKTSKNAGFETNGYKNYTGKTFAGYTQGPRYWGKTFFVWPPDPTNDWRKQFFFKSDGKTPLDDNTLLWDSSGSWKVPRDSSQNNYRINYAEILKWIKTDPNPFPSRLRAGRILYYDAIPDSIPTSPFPPTDLNQRFWKDYIDYVLGLNQTGGGGASPVYQLITSRTGYGDDFTWGTIQIKAKPSGKDTRYMDYKDNPKRPKLHFWCGPMTMLDFLGNYNLGSVVDPNWKQHWWWPGTAHEAPLWQLKIGIQAALQDIERNHPNDFVSLIYFSSPENSPGSPNLGRFNRVRGPMGRDYTRMLDTLWYPLTTIDNPGTENRPYDFTNNHETPRALGATSPAMGFMLAYNQFSSDFLLRKFAPKPAPEGEAGGLGRKGSQKLVILETDGMANTAAKASYVNAGPNHSYYRVRQPGEYPSASGSVVSQIYDVVDQLVALETASSPGYSTNRKSVLIHCLAFGTLFEPYSTDPDKADALDLLQNIQYKGKTQSSPSTALQSNKIIVGSAQQRIDRLREAFRAIMQDGVQVSLIE